MTVYKDSERGTFYFITRINGKQVKRRGFKTKSEAKRAEAKALLDFEDMNDENTSFEKIAEEYLNWYEKRRKLSSYTKISSIVNIHLIPYFGKKKLNAIRPRHITIYQDSIIDKFAPSHVKKIHTVLSAIFNYAIKQEYTKDNPARTVGNVELEEDKHINFWILNEFKTFIKHVDDFMFYTLFMVLYYSGMRKGELLALTWADIDFDNNLINVNKTAYNRVITKPKTRSSIRQIKMPKHVMRLLSQLKAQSNPKMSYVVFGEFHDHISTTTLDRKYERWVKESKVNKIRLHDFRHSHASYLINKGTIASVIAKRLGHSNVATTLNVYSHLYPSTEEEAVLKMEDDFRPAEIIQLGAN